MMKRDDGGRRSTILFLCKLRARRVERLPIRYSLQRFEDNRLL